MYQVLYRKWRPHRFADVVGQPQVTKTLCNELASGRIANAYLFTGMHGTGKTTCAKILAQAINCLSPVNGDPCGECEICRGIKDGTVMDIVEIDAASNNGVDSIRTLREEANFTPAKAKYRVYIIDEVHMLSIGAFNALLKTLEEPPAHVVFILATTEVHKLPATILSRCQRFDFHRISSKDISDRLTYITEHEGGTLEPDAALLISRLSDGALRDAVSLLDQCLGKSKNITTEVVNITAGLADKSYLFNLAETIREKDSNSVLSIIDDLYKDGKDMTRLCEEFSSHLRDLMLIKTMKDISSVITLTKDEKDKLTKQAVKISLPCILNAIDVMRDTLSKISAGQSPRIEMEMAFVKLTSPQLDSSVSSLTDRIEKLEGTVLKLTNGIKPPEFCEKQVKSIQSSPEVTENVIKAPKVKTTSEELSINAKPFTQWPEVLQILKKYSPTVSAAFKNSTAYINGEYILIDSIHDYAFELLRNSSQRGHIKEALLNATGHVYKLGPYKINTPEKKQKDPLIELAEKAKAEGINVTNS